MALRARAAVLGQGHENDPLADLTAICRAARVTVRESELGGARGGQEALLSPLDHDRFAIAVDPTPRGGWCGDGGRLQDDIRRQRVRFRIAHELGHTFFYWRDSGRPRRHLFDSAAQERFCDVFAAALLMPPGVASQAPASAQAIVYLQERFDVSLEVVVRSFAEGHPQAKVSLWFARAGDEGQLQLQWSSSNTECTTLSRQDVFPVTTSVESQWLPGRRQLLLCST